MSDLEDLRPITQWPQKRERLQRRYPELTEDDLTYVAGEEAALYGRIGRRLEKDREETRNIIRKI